MKIEDLIDSPEIKVEVLRKGLDSKPRLMYRADLLPRHTVRQIKAVIQKIKEKYTEHDEPCVLKLLSDDPVIFALVPQWGSYMFRFTIIFPESLKHIQNDLITGISKFSKSR